MEPDDIQLIKEYGEGREEALGALFQRHKTRVFNYAQRFLNNRADAEDVTAEVFIMLINRKYVYQPDTKFTTWLYVVTRNACITRLRKRNRFSFLGFTRQRDGRESEWQAEDTRDLPREAMIDKERARAVRRAIAAMRGPQKEALILREYERLSYAEIAEVIDCSVDSVKVLIFRAREHLRNELISLLEEGQDG